MREWREQLNAFFAFAAEEGWIAQSPVNGFRKPKAEARPTLPLSVDEVRRLLRAAAAKPREQALILLLRYSGLAIRDAATLRRDALQPGGELVLRRANSGELVTVALPEEVTLALETAAAGRQEHYFWTGRSQPETAAKFWRGRLRAVARAAGIEGFHPHRLRDTFAAELLLADVSMGDVSTLLGHSSVATTERYYAPWSSARRNRLGRIVRKVHQRDPILLEFTPKKPPGAAQTAPGEAGLATRNVPNPACSCVAYQMMWLVVARLSTRQGRCEAADAFGSRLPKAEATSLPAGPTTYAAACLQFRRGPASPTTSPLSPLESSQARLANTTA